MLRRLSILAVLIAAAGTTLAAPAHAAGHVICVGSPVGTCDEHKSTIQLALSTAFGNGLTNTILVGPGTYSDGPYNLDGSVAGVTLKGSGQGVTTLTAPANATPQNYIQAYKATVQDLTVALAATDSTGDRALTLERAIVDHVAVVGPGTENVTGIVGQTESAIRHSSVQLPLGVGNTGVAGHGGLTVSDTTITASDAFRHSSTTTDTLSRVSIRTDGRGVSTDWGPATIDDTLINLGTADQAKGIEVANTNDSTVPKAITADHVTIVGGGAGSYGVYVWAARANALQQSSATLTNAIVRGPATDLDAIAGNNGAQGGNSVATITTSYSDWHSQVTISQPHGTAQLVSGAGHLDVAPIFVDASHGNYRLAPGSPVVDRGTPGTSTPTLDLDRHARIQDGNRDGAAIRDMGAYESAPDVTAPNTAITAHPKKRTTKHRVTFAFTSTEASVTFQCKLDAKPWRSCSSPKRYRVTRGWHRFKVRAVDAARNVDATPARFRFHRV